MNKLSLLESLEKHLLVPAKLDYHPINGLSDISLVQRLDIILSDNSKSIEQIIRLLSSYMLVAPVCLQREERVIRVYGEKLQIKTFKTIVDRIQEYQHNNGLINLKSKVNSLKVRKASVDAHYSREKSRVVTWLGDHKNWRFMSRKQRTEYQYKLLLVVAKMENLIPDKYMYRSTSEYNLGWHVSYHKFQNRKVLTTKCIYGVN